MPCPHNLTTETVIAEAAREVAEGRLRWLPAFVVFRDW